MAAAEGGGLTDCHICRLSPMWQRGQRDFIAAATMQGRSRYRYEAATDDQSVRPEI
jgi:hypothetical protein